MDLSAVANPAASRAAAAVSQAMAKLGASGADGGSDGSPPAASVLPSGSTFVAYA